MARKSYTVAYKPGVNLRSRPSKGSPILRVLKLGEKVVPDNPAKEAEMPEGWIPVKGGGYVMMEFLK